MRTAPDAERLARKSEPLPASGSLVLTPRAVTDGVVRRGANLTPSASLIRAIFLVALGGIDLISFLSLWVQVEGLVGSNGILPIAPFLDLLRERAGPERYWFFPTLLWIDSGDFSLHLLSGLGVGFSLLLVVVRRYRYQAAVLGALWILTLSLVVGGRVFLSYQWDILLLEMGFLAIFFRPGSRIVPWLFRWLLFRLIFSSGVVKLLSGDPVWLDLTALQYHYETQPLPTWIGWYAHQLPAWFQQFSCGLMFAIEVAVPFLIFGPRRFRLIAFWPLVGLQLLIALTGNYCFFNLLTVALCLLLWYEPGEGGEWPRWFVVSLSVFLVTLSLTTMALRFRIAGPWIRPLAAVTRVVSPFNLVNAYGLFAVMTRPRYEVVIEGSRDGESWHEYEFRWKPGDPSRRPGFVAPHQPRLDWQMWFAALEPRAESPWFRNLMIRLLEGSPEVLSLFDRNPFPEGPPRYLRAVRTLTRFTDRGERAATGAWWTRERIGPYSGVVEGTLGLDSRSLKY